MVFKKKNADDSAGGGSSSKTKKKREPATDGDKRVALLAILAIVLMCSVVYIIMGHHIVPRTTDVMLMCLPQTEMCYSVVPISSQPTSLDEISQLQESKPIGTVVTGP